MRSYISVVIHPTQYLAGYSDILLEVTADLSSGEDLVAVMEAAVEAEVVAVAVDEGDELVSEEIY